MVYGRYGLVISACSSWLCSSYAGSIGGSTDRTAPPASVTMVLTDHLTGRRPVEARRVLARTTTEGSSRQGHATPVVPSLRQ